MNAENDKAIEALADLQRALNHECLLRSQTESLIESLSALVNPTSISQLLLDLLEMMRKLTHFDRACIFSQDVHGDFKTVAATHPAFEKLQWRRNELLSRALSSNVINLQDAGNHPDFLLLPEDALSGVNSALLVGLKCDAPAVILLCTHPGPDCFPPDQVNLIKRYLPLVAQALKGYNVQEYLRRSEERFRMLIACQDDGSVIINLEERFELANSASEMIFGVEATGLIGRHISDFLSAIEYLKVRERLSVCEHDLKTSFEIEITRPDGEVRNLAVTSTPVRNSESVMTGTFCVCHDITERLRATAKLQKQLEFKTVIAEVATHFLTMNLFDEVINDSLRLLGKSREACRAYIFRFSDDMRTMSITHEWHAENVSPEIENLQKLPAENFLWSVNRFRLGESVIIHDTRQLPLEASSEKKILETRNSRSAIGIPFFIDARPAGFIGLDFSYVTDVRSEDEVDFLQTFAVILGGAYEKKIAQNRLIENEAKYRYLVERASDGIAIIQDDVIKYANPHLAEFGGYSHSEIIGKSFVEYVHPDKRDLLLGMLHRRLNGEKTIPVYETVLLSKGGNPVEVEISAGIIPYEGRPADLVLARDISQRRRSEEALKESEERFRAIATVAKDAICIIDHEGLITYWNPAAVVSFGYSVKDVCKRRLSMIFEDGRIPENPLNVRIRDRGKPAAAAAFPGV